MPRILLVNPPIYDFSADDFWLRPYGMLQVAGMLRGQVQMSLFDFLDRGAAQTCEELSNDKWGRGKLPSQVVSKPAAFAKIPRRFRRLAGRGRSSSISSAAPSRLILSSFKP